MKPKQIREALEEWLGSPEGDRYAHVRFILLELAETIFFASLATEEKMPTRVAIAWALRGATDLRKVRDDDDYPTQYEEPELAWEVLPFEGRMLDVASLVKAAPLAEFGRSVLVVGGEPGRFFLDGIARQNNRTNGGRVFILYAAAPGVVSIVCEMMEIFRFERGASVAPAPSVLWGEGPVKNAISAVGSALQLKVTFLIQEPFTQVVRGLVTAMSRTQHGGLMLLLPNSPTPEMLSKVKLKITEPTILSSRIRKAHEAYLAWFDASWVQKEDEEGLTPQEAALKEERQAANVELERTVTDVGRLTAVDNAVLIGPGFNVLGAQFEVPSEDAPEVKEAHDTAGTALTAYDMRRHGSRHRAAAAFAANNQGALALVASADGPMRCFLRVGENVLMWRIQLEDV